MLEIKFRVWHKKEQKMYFRGYQKLWHILLCEDDQGSFQGKGVPVKRGRFEDCELLQTTGLTDKNGREIFEGDIVRILCGEKIFTDTVESIPDMFKSRRLHPLHDLLSRSGVSDREENMEIEILGNRYENPQKIFK